MGSGTETFHWFDYVVFSASLLISCGIGVFFAFTGGRQKTQKEYLMGDRKMKTLPVATSLLVSFVSSVLIIGLPAEVYKHGALYWLGIFAIVISCVLSTRLFVPLLYPLKLTSSYEYLELRFQSRSVKVMGSLLLIISQVIYMGIASFSPATVLSAVTGIPVWAIILCVVSVATFYTTLGGMKAVIWTDVFQAVILLGGMFAIVIVGCLEVGGIGNVWRANSINDRLSIFNFDLNPTTRITVWGMTIGSAADWLSFYGINQTCVQRFCSLPTLTKAKRAVLLNIPGKVVLNTLAVSTGLVMYAYFANCDPLTHPDPNQRLDNANQIVPYFVLRVLGWPGFPGLFVASIFAASLSTVSSCLNALAAVTWEDMLKWKFDYLSEGTKTYILKVIVCFYGIAATGTAFAALLLKGTVLEASVSFMATSSSPLLGLFVLGAIFPWANWLGSIIGACFGLAMPMWLSIGSYVFKRNIATKYISTLGCEWNTTDIYWEWNSTNYDSLSTISTAIEQPTLDGVAKLYSISFMWRPLIGVSTTVVMGLIASLLASPFIDAPRAGDIERRYLIPACDQICCCLPKSWRKHFLCGTKSSADSYSLNHEDIKHISVTNGENELIMKSKLALGHTKENKTVTAQSTMIQDGDVR